ncbi:unnamed protein product [Ectocarpus sp. 8 AP-2014]
MVIKHARSENSYQNQALFLLSLSFFVCWVRLVDAGVSACALYFCAALLAAGLVCVSEEDETTAAAAATQGVWMSLVPSASWHLCKIRCREVHMKLD